MDVRRVEMLANRLSDVISAARNEGMTDTEIGTGVVIAIAGLVKGPENLAGFVALVEDHMRKLK